MATPVPPRAGMTLSFADEFERTSLNGAGSPGWLTTYFWGARRLGEFNQQQIFVDPSFGPGGIDPFAFKDGTVAITADRTPEQWLSGYGYPYTSGHMSSYDTFNFRYGYIEMRAKPAKGQGFLETFYASRTDRSVLGEIDVLEFIGSQPKALYGTVHFEEPGGTLTKAKVVRAAMATDMTLDHHTYAVDWTPTSIRFHFDGTLMGEMETPGSLKAAVYLMADFSVGGVWAGYPDSTTPFPSEYAIDYIRVWQEAYAFVPETVVGTGGSETLAGGDGADTITAGAGNDTVLAGGGDDIIRGGPGDDRLQGNGGSDTLVGEAGTDWLQGGPGNDFYPLLDGGDSITDGRIAGFDTVLTPLAAYTTPNNIEAVIYTGIAPTALTGQWSGNLLVGGPGDDRLDGLQGDDTLAGGSGSDLMIGGPGSDLFVTRGGGDDTIVSGIGRDTLQFGPSASPSVVTVTDFVPGSDRLDFRRLGIDTLAELQAVMRTDAAGKAVIAENGTTVLLNVEPSAIKAADLVTEPLGAPVAPVVSMLSHEVILASAPVGTAVSIFVPKAVPEPLTYALLSGGAGKFAVEGRQLVVTGPLDAGASYTLLVRATNEFGLTRDQSFTVKAAGNTAPYGLALSNATMTDAAAIGTVVGTLSAVDPDPGDRLTYALTGSAGGVFAVEGSLLKVASAPHPIAYSITVAVTDLGGLSVTRTFTVDVRSSAIFDGVTVVGSAGNDVVSPSTTIPGQPPPGTRGDSILGNLGNDTLDGGAGGDRIDGGPGADKLIGGPGADTLIGGTGLDVASYMNASAAIAVDVENAKWTGAQGDAAGDVFSQLEGIEGSGFGDTILGGAVADRLYGLGGNDMLAGRAGDDLLFGGDAHDTLEGGAGRDLLNGGAGSDEFVFAAGSGRDVVNGFAAGNGTGDVLVFRGTFTSLAEVLAAMRDVVGGTSPFDAAFTGAVLTRGADEVWLSGLAKAKFAADDFRFETVVAPPPPDPGVTVTGTAGADVINPTRTVDGQPSPGGGNDLVNAQAGDDFIDAGAGDDRIYGWEGDDTIVGGPGKDILNGGDGFDLVTYAATSAPIAVDLIAPNWTGARGDAAGDTFFSIEAIEGGASGDTIIGSNEGMRIDGLGGDDLLQGRVGTDTLQGGDGADTLIGGAGNDLLAGGAGNDLFDFSSGSGQDLITDFVAGDAVGDVVRFRSGPTDFAAVAAASSDLTGVSPDGAAFSGVVIGTGTDTLWLQGVTKAGLHANDFVFG